MSKPTDAGDGIMIEESKVRTVIAAFKDGSDKDDRFVSITEWINGDGYDVEVEGKPSFSLTGMEATALCKVLARIDG